MVTFILTLIATIGTLTIVAYLRQVEDKMPELLTQMELHECPVCQVPHLHEKKPKRSFIKIKRDALSNKKKSFGYFRRNK